MIDDKINLDLVLTNEIVNEYKKKKIINIELNSETSLSVEEYKTLYKLLNKVDFNNITLSSDKFVFRQLSKNHYKIIKNISLLTYDTLEVLEFSELFINGTNEAIKFWKMFKNTKVRKITFHTKIDERDVDVPMGIVNAKAILNVLFCDIEFSVNYTSRSNFRGRPITCRYEIKKPNRKLTLIFWLYKFNLNDELLLKTRSIIEKSDLLYVMRYVIKTKNKTHFQQSSRKLKGSFQVRIFFLNFEFNFLKYI